jgi:transposase-like protein
MSVPSPSEGARSGEIVPEQLPTAPVDSAAADIFADAPPLGGDAEPAAGASLPVETAGQSPAMSADAAVAPLAGQPESAPADGRAEAFTAPGAAMPRAEASDPETASWAHGKRPCFHCGAMTSIRILERTGDLCWRCYRPAGAGVVRTLITLLVLVGLAAGGVIVWQRYQRPDAADTGTTPSDAAPAAAVSTTKQYTVEQRIDIVHRHLQDQVPIAALCKEYAIQPSEYREWEQKFMEAATQALIAQARPHEATSLEQRLTSIEQRLQQVSNSVTDIRGTLNQIRSEASRYEGSPTQQYILNSGQPPHERQSP